MVPLNISAPTVIVAERRHGTPTERLAELVRHLSDVSLTEARRAVHHNALVDQLDDPLAIVAGALVHLRHQHRHQVAPCARP